MRSVFQRRRELIEWPFISIRCRRHQEREGGGGIITQKNISFTEMYLKVAHYRKMSKYGPFIAMLHIFIDFP